MRELSWLLMVFVACTGDDKVGDSADTAAPDDTGQPDVGCGSGAAFDASLSEVCPGFAAVNLRIDDGVGRFGTAAVLYWQGAFGFDPTTRIMNASTTWTAPYPLLADDGPWDDGGHEPTGSTAGDAVWGYTAFFDLATLPGGAETTIEYGAVREDPAGPWIWNRGNPQSGQLTVGPSDDGGSIDPGDLTIPPFGDVDLRFTFDSAALQALDHDMDGTPSFPDWDPANGLRIKSPWWDWIEVDTLANADNSQFTVELSGLAANDDLVTGLAESQAAFWFVAVLVDSTGGSEDYSVDGSARSEGVTVEGRRGSDSYAPLAVSVEPFNDGEVLQVFTP